MLNEIKYDNLINNFR